MCSTSAASAQLNHITVLFSLSQLNSIDTREFNWYNGTTLEQSRQIEHSTRIEIQLPSDVQLQ